MPVNDASIDAFVQCRNNWQASAKVSLEVNGAVDIDYTGVVEELNASLQELFKIPIPPTKKDLDVDLFKVTRCWRDFGSLLSACVLRAGCTSNA